MSTNYSNNGNKNKLCKNSSIEEQSIAASKRSKKALIDQALVKKILDHNDHFAYDKLWKRYEKAILVFVRNILKNKLDAEDVMSISLTKAFLNLDKYNPNYSFSNWVYTIATRTAIDFNRVNSLDTQPIVNNYDGDSFEIEIKDYKLNPEDAFILSQRRSMVRTAISCLGEPFRSLVYLKFIDQKTYKEIAELKNMPIGTVKTNIFRGTKKLFLIIRGVVNRYY